MSTKYADEENSTDRGRGDASDELDWSDGVPSDYERGLLPQHAYLGRDREGFGHHLDRERDVVLRFDDEGTIERVTELDGRGLDTYLSFIAEGVGWADRRQLATWDVFPEGL